MNIDQIHWKTEGVVDAHAHFPGKEGIEHFLKILEITSTQQINVLVGPGPRTAKVMDFVMEQRAAHPERIYAFAGICHKIGEASLDDGAYLAQQVEDAYLNNFDGLKMLEGKPMTRRKVAPFALDSDYYRAYWERVIEYDMPVTLHVADPISFWEVDNPHKYAEDMDSKESFYTEIYNVLERHPTLRVSLAHFFFMANDLKRCADLFDRFPNVRFDTAPNPDLMFHLAYKPEESREFLIKYADRVMYGTDINDGNSLYLARAKAENLRLLFESDIRYEPVQNSFQEKPVRSPTGDHMLQGLALPDDALRKICRDNFHDFAAPLPKKNLAKAV